LTLLHRHFLGTCKDPVEFRLLVEQRRAGNKRRKRDERWSDSENDAEDISVEGDGIAGFSGRFELALTTTREQILTLIKVNTK
jgi:hypothetical protein